MITKQNFKSVLSQLGFTANSNDIYTKKFAHIDCQLQADFTNQKLIYPTEKGFVVNDETTSNFSHDENFVVFECVARLFEKGYRPEHIELEPRWSLGHGGKSGKADICVKNKDGQPYLCIIECKTADAEYKKEKQNMINEEGGQLFSYWEQERATKWLILYASDFDGEKVSYTTLTVNCSDDENLLELSKDDKSLKLYKDATNAKSLFEVWKETYEQKFLGDLIFDEETVAYDIGVLPLKKKRLVDFNRDDKIVNQFEEILRHNNVSDKENAFNRLIALFIAKLYDEKTKAAENIVDFQYKSGTDTYQQMQDRLQKLHHLGMKEFMKEEVFYVADDYVQKIMKGAIGENRAKLEAELNETITKLKFYTNNDFAFKDVHNKTLFYQNGKILVEMVELFQKYRIIDSNELQLLGDMFEQLLNKGFKQNEGQFFTPVPITSFIWKCLPLESLVIDAEKNEVRYPKIIDYACGAGHFLTEGFREINETLSKLNLPNQKGWERDCIFGIEKDYRLARVSKISLFMHGADGGNIVFGDGLDNHTAEIAVKNGEFDILVANPPYSVSAFKNHLELKNNKLELFDFITKDGKEIETLFVERIAQLLNPNGIAAVILPSSILSNSSASYIKAREVLLKNFALRAIVQFGSKTFGATGTNTVVLYLQKNSEPPVKHQIIYDNVSAIFANEKLNVKSDIEIFDAYCEHIQVPKDDYIDFLKNARQNNSYECYKDAKNYFAMYVEAFEMSAAFKAAQKQDEKQKTKAFTAKAFYNFVLEVEKEKVYFFALVYTQQVLVATAPSDNSEQEKFLGYSWSNRKGDEGIKLKEEKLVGTKCGFLYNTAEEEASVARYVKDSFLGIYRTEGALQKYLAVCNLCDMLDFSRTSFDKAIRTQVIGNRFKGIGISGESVMLSASETSKFPLVKLGEVAEIVRGVTFDKNLQINENMGKVVLTADNVSLDGHFSIEKEIFVSNDADFDEEKKLKKNDCFMCFSSGSRNHVGKVALIKNDTDYYAGGFMGILRTKEKISPHFLYEILNSNSTREIVKASAKGSNILNLSNSIGELKIPLPPLDVQRSIIAECEKVDADFANAQKQIEVAKQQIAEIMQKTTDLSSLSVRLGEVAEIIKGVTFDKNLQISENKGKIVLTADNISLDGHFTIQKEIYISNDADFDENKKLKKDDCFICFSSGSRNHVGKVALISEDTNYYAGGFMGILRPTDKIIPHYLYDILNSTAMREKVKNSATGSNILNLSTSIKDLQIPLPSLAEQQKIVSEVQVLEQNMAIAKNVLADCPARKAEILRKWLE